MKSALASLHAAVILIGLADLELESPALKFGVEPLVAGDHLNRSLDHDGGNGFLAGALRRHIDGHHAASFFAAVPTGRHVPFSTQ